MYFQFYKLQSWGKRSASRRRRFIQRFLRASRPTGSLLRWDQEYCLQAFSRSTVDRSHSSWILGTSLIRRLV